MDIAVRPDGGLYLAELGMEATVYELDAAGRVAGRYPVGFGVTARVGAAADGPRVFVGPGQTEDQSQPIEAERISTPWPVVGALGVAALLLAPLARSCWRLGWLPPMVELLTMSLAAGV